MAWAEIRSSATSALLGQIVHPELDVVTGNGEPFIGVADLDGDGVGDIDRNGHPDLLALVSSIGGGPGARLIALDPSRKDALLFEQVMPNLDAGYSNSQRIGDLPGLDPYGNPTFVVFEGLTGLVAVRRATVRFSTQRHRTNISSRRAS